MLLGTVKEILLRDDNPNELNKIIVSIQDGGITTLQEAYPLSLNIKSIPIYGEQVCLISANISSVDAYSVSNKRFYFLNTVALQNNVNHNALPPLNLKKSRNTTQLNISNASIGIPTSFGGDTTYNLGDGFVELPELASIQPFLGDTIIEGRFGQSIRMGYTPDTNESTKKPNWTSNNNSSPITIIRNGGGFSDGYNKFTIEDINTDDSSIYLTSKQKIKLSFPNNKIPIGLKSVTDYDNPQIVLNSDRVVINSKRDGVIIRGSKSVYLVTQNWKADMDVVLSQVKEIQSQVESLVDALNQFTTALNTTPAAPAVTPLTTQLPSIKIALQSIGLKLERMQ